MDKQPASEVVMLLISCECKTAPQNAVLVWHKLYHAQMAASSLIFIKVRMKESFYQKEVVKVTMINVS